MGFIWLKNLQIIGISELCIEKEPSGMMDIIIEPNISFRVQVVINTVYLSCSLDSSL